MQFNYRYMKNAHGGICSCESCESEAPLEWFEDGWPRVKKKICEICATTLVGRLTPIPLKDVTEYTAQETVKAMAQIGNHLLDKLTPRLTGIKAAETIPSEPEE